MNDLLIQIWKGEESGEWYADIQRNQDCWDFTAKSEKEIRQKVIKFLEKIGELKIKRMRGK